MSATRAAIEEGIVPGGGTALLRSRAAISKLKLSGDEATGAQLVYRALDAPARQIAQNAASIAALLLTTETLVTDKPEEPDPAAAAAAMAGGGMGGMGGMM